MKNITRKIIFILLIICSLICCKSTPEPTVSKAAPEVDSVPVTDPAPVIEPEPLQSFNESMISSAQKEEEKNEIDSLVKELNKITQNKTYESWLKYLSDEYKQYYSDPEVLRAQSARLPVKNIQLLTLKDYFNYVFVVSRQHCRVDDISYLTATRVKVIQRAQNKSLIIYNLEKSNGEWKIILEN